MRPNRILFLLAVVAFLGGCSTSPVSEPTLYLLRGAPTEGSGPVSAVPRVGLGRVTVAPYLLSSRGVVVETAPGQVRPARQHQWAEPLDAGLRWYLRSEITRALGSEVSADLSDLATWDYTIDVNVSRLHGTLAGTALLEAVYVLRARDGRGPIAENRFTKTVSLPAEGYAAVVQAERRLLAELAGRIAQTLETTVAAAEPSGAP